MSRSSMQLLPRWASPQNAIWSTGILAMMTVLLAAIFMLYEYQETVDEIKDQNELYARTLESGIDQAATNTEFALRGLGRLIEDHPIAEQRDALKDLLHQSLSGLPMVRSLSLLDAKGMVLASSVDKQVGQQVPIKQLQRLADRPPQGLGPVQNGQDLLDLAHPSGAQGTAAPALITLTQPLQRVGAAHYLVAVISPTFFDHFIVRQLGDSGRRAAIYSVEGQLLASSQGLTWQPGQIEPRHWLFGQGPLDKLKPVYRAAGLDGVPGLGHFRLTRDHPWLVAVELTDAQLWQRLRSMVQSVSLLTLLTLGLELAMGWFAWRGLSAYVAARRSLENAHRSLADKQREQSLLINSVNELMFRTDANGLLQFVNHPKMLGLSEQEPDPPMDLATLVDPRDQHKARAVFKEASGFLNLPTSLRMGSASDQQRTLEVRATPIRNAMGLITGFAGFAVDVTEREDARERLQAQLDFTARLIDVCPAPLFAKDHQLRYTMVNQAWCDMTGIEKDLALGRRLSDLRPEQFAAPAEQRDRTLLTKGGNERFEENDNGHDLIVHKTVFTDAKGRHAGILGSMVDISRFIEGERRISEARDAAERANRIKTEFVANMSHELRSPLQSILGYSELGIARSAQHDKLREMFNRIHTAGSSMLSLINDLLDLSRLESPVGSLRLEVQDLRPLLQTCVREAEMAADRRGLRVELELPTDEVRAAIDPPRLLQAFGNVLDNAVRLSPADTCISVSVQSDLRGTRVLIRDQGPGIPETELESIFTPFVQGTAGQETTGGTGLGLAICRKIMSAHGGSIVARNHPQGGAVFELLLPAV